MASSSSELNPIVIALEKHIPAELLKNKFIWEGISFPKKKMMGGGLTDLFIRGIKNTAICEALVEAFEFNELVSKANSLLGEEPFGTYCIRIPVNLASDELVKHLEKLDPKKTQDKLTELVIQKSGELLVALKSNIEKGKSEGLYDHLPEKISAVFKRQVQSLEKMQAPSSLAEVISASAIYDKVNRAYNVVSMTKPKPQHGLPAEVKSSGADQKSSNEAREEGGPGGPKIRGGS